MNRVILCGRAVRDPEVRYSANQTAVARYTLAVDRIKDGTDFINCVAFVKSAEFAEKYIHKGTKIIVEGRIQTSSYTNKDGQKVNTTEVVVEHQEFAESKKSESQEAPQTEVTGWMNVPEGVDEDLPFAQPTR